MRHKRQIETRSALPIETRNEDEGRIRSTRPRGRRRAAHRRRAVPHRHRGAADHRAPRITERLDEIDARTQRPGGSSAATTRCRSSAAPSPASCASAASALRRRGARPAGRRRHGGRLSRARRVRGRSGEGHRRGSPDPPGGPRRQHVGRLRHPAEAHRPHRRRIGSARPRIAPETGPTYGQLEIPVHEMACYVDVSNRLLEDAAVNVEDEVAFDLAEEFGRLEGVAFVNGDGVKKPVGVMAAAGVPTASTATRRTCSADALITLMYALPAVYRNSGAWMMNGTTLATVRKLKDGQGNYLWQPAIRRPAGNDPRPPGDRGRRHGRRRRRRRPDRLRRLRPRLPHL